MWCNSSRCDYLENWDNIIASYTAALAQDWIKKKRPGFTGKKRMANEFARSQFIGLSCVVRNAGFKYREGSYETFELLTKKLCKV